jgi:hypothetical protein
MGGLMPMEPWQLVTGISILKYIQRSKAGQPARYRLRGNDMVKISKEIDVSLPDQQKSAPLKGRCAANTRNNQTER